MEFYFGMITSAMEHGYVCYNSHQRAAHKLCVPYYLEDRSIRFPNVVDKVQYSQNALLLTSTKTQIRNIVS